ncbi:hypothetical protein [Komagataeibacter swingsii]|uniref:hypothetical protein n=1 Tax=Komagataeibacter swingsii TaxID=215220 RepID=UPI0011B81C0E|nr:hypothetical protein [Komagataeibacter swingsii]
MATDFEKLCILLACLYCHINGKYRFSNETLLNLIAIQALQQPALRLNLDILHYTFMQTVASIYCRWLLPAHLRRIQAFGPEDPRPTVLSGN